MPSYAVEILWDSLVKVWTAVEREQIPSCWYAKNEVGSRSMVGLSDAVLVFFLI